MASRNPFRPTAGATPPLLVGRSGQLQAFRESLEMGSGAPGLLSLVTGARGVGKTVMLTALGDVARQEGWLVVDETATPGVRDRLAVTLQGRLDDVGASDRARLSGLTFSGMGVTRDLPPRRERTWRESVGDLLDVLQQKGSGLLVTIDEIHAVDSTDMQQLAADVQHLVREGRPIGLVMAGLPSAITDLLNDHVSTFLRRAERIELGAVDVSDVEESLRETFANSGRTLKPEQLRATAEATGGYPFMIQLVGFNVWRLANDAGVVDAKAVEEGVSAARVRLGALVHETSLQDLSQVDRTVLAAMAQDDGPTRVADIATRIGRDRNYVSVYRDRLLKAGMIVSTTHGHVDFALPHLREYLREHAVVSHPLGDSDGV